MPHSTVLMTVNCAPMAPSRRALTIVTRSDSLHRSEQRSPLPTWQPLCIAHRYCRTAVPRAQAPPRLIMSGTTEHIFSVDVEEYFQVHAFEGIVRRTEWPTLPSRIERNVDTLLELLARHDVS